MLERVVFMEELNQNDYKILQSFVGRDGKGMSKIRSLTCKNVSEITELSLVKVKNTVKILLELGLILNGIMRVRAKTYYISEKGIETLREIKRQTNTK